MIGMVPGWRRLLPACILAALVSGLPSPVRARTWNITASGTGDAPTIQAGIDSASAGDSVLVAAGTYLENIDFKGKAIVVKGAGAESAIIDGSALDETCVLFDSGETHESIFEDFTLTGGRGHALSGGTHVGGGINVFNSEPSLRRLRIVDNQASTSTSGTQVGFGGGLSCAGDGRVFEPVIEDCVIDGNQAGNSGGGVAITGSVSASIRNNVLKRNRAIAGDGGGMWLLLNTDGTAVEGNVIEENEAHDHGGGILAAQGNISGLPLQLTFSRNLIVRNIARFFSDVEAAGGGLYLEGTAAWIHHNTIVENTGGTALSDTTAGGGIAIVNGSPTIEQNIIAYSLYGGSVRCTGSGLPMFRDNLTWSNIVGEGSGTCAMWWEGNGNIVADPFFCAYLAGDYALAENSPALLHPAGPLGTLPVAGCGPVSVERTTWGRIKATFGQ